MTDPQPAPPPTPPAPATPTPTPAPAPAAAAPAAPSAISNMLAGMSQIELLIAGGAALIVITALVFTIFNGYYINDLPLAGAAVALVTVLWHRRLPSGVASMYNWLLIGLTVLVVVIAARSLLGDIIYIATPPAGVTVPRMIGMLGFYIGAVLMALGAWRLWKSRSA